MSILNLTFLEIENSSLNLDWEIFPVADLNSTLSSNLSSSNSTSAPPVVRNYVALLLIVFPFLTLFGNVLVILAVYRERSLQTATNYYIISLALADLLVAVVVMPFAVYFQVNGEWGLPPFACDFYIAMDVTCSTSSIFNLVAISIDRYIAVTQPIKYAKQKNNSRAWLLIIVVWVVSIAIGSPIVLGLNYTPNRIPGLCIFYNTDFIIYSSLSSFYIPCVIMVFLYYSIFNALRNRAKKQKAARKSHLDMKPGIVIENVAQTRRLAETSMVASTLLPTTSIDDGPTNTGSGSQDEDDEGERSPGSEDCHVIPNDKSTEFILATVIEETAAVGALTAKPGDEKGNNDSGYAASQLEDIAATISPPTSPQHRAPTANPADKSAAASSGAATSSVARRNGSASTVEGQPPPAPVKRPLTASVRTSSEDEGSGSKKERKASSGTRFTIYKVNKASRKKREKSSAKKERKATKTLAIVLGVFLFCWVPFFTCNVMDAVCTKLEADCTPSLTTFLITTWLGYMNSFVNPVIYTIFNPEFRKAFKKIMMIGT